MQSSEFHENIKDIGTGICDVSVQSWQFVAAIHDEADGSDTL